MVVLGDSGPNAVNLFLHPMIRNSPTRLRNRNCLAALWHIIYAVAGLSLQHDTVGCDGAIWSYHGGAIPVHSYPSLCSCSKENLSNFSVS